MSDQTPDLAERIADALADALCLARSRAAAATVIRSALTADREARDKVLREVEQALDEISGAAFYAEEMDLHYKAAHAQAALRSLTNTKP